MSLSIQFVALSLDVEFLDEILSGIHRIGAGTTNKLHKIKPDLILLQDLQDIFHVNDITPETAIVVMDVFMQPGKRGLRALTLAGYELAWLAAENDNFEQVKVEYAEFNLPFFRDVQVLMQVMLWGRGKE